MTERPRQVHLAAHFPGVNNTTVWSDPAAGSHIEFSSFVKLAQTAERAKFDFFFLAEGLRLREQRGQIHELDVVGRPDTFTVLAGLAAVTEHIGLSGTINSTFNEPYEVARQFASLDHLSGGRAAWNVVTSWDAFTGENFRRGGFLAQEERYDRAKEFLETARELWDSWHEGAVVADKDAGRFIIDADEGDFAHSGSQFDISGRFSVPRSPQGHPVIFQAGDSDTGREFAAADADCIFTRHGTIEAGQRFYEDVKGRLPRYGRSPEDLKILPAATFVLGETEADAAERSAVIRQQQVSGPTAILFLEQVWNRDLSAYDPDGPLPDVEPDLANESIVQGRVPVFRDRMDTATRWRELAEARSLSIRELMIEVTNPASFVGTPVQVANQMEKAVALRAADGFILVPHVTPGGLDDFTDSVVPILQERNRFRTDYEGTTLRDHLGLPPARSSTRARSIAGAHGS
ncbi:MAG: NtaA/DmoA family FMN-dependent monooxygenase [Acidimicrobiales bacterium]|jgi:FMN-dependent oxidoreductase (nitrilotriacetate monooxygenase family)